MTERRQRNGGPQLSTKVAVNLREILKKGCVRDEIRTEDDFKGIEETSLLLAGFLRRPKSL